VFLNATTRRVPLALLITLSSHETTWSVKVEDPVTVTNQGDTEQMMRSFYSPTGRNKVNPASRSTACSSSNPPPIVK